jgi:DivIVA domain-containing protein
VIHLSQTRRSCQNRLVRREFRGYDPAAVDAFLGRCFGRAGLDPQRVRPGFGVRLTADEIRGARFGKAWLGYPIRTVDALLDQLAEAAELTTLLPATGAAAAQAPRRISLVDTEQESLART